MVVMRRRKCVLYVRVSTAGQAMEDVGYSIPEQIERLKAYCTSRDWEIVEIYIDGGFSGANLERPGIEKLINDIEKKQFDTVLVYKLDRLSRSQKDTLFLIEDVFLPSNIDFVSLQETLDTATPFGRAMIGILSVFSQLERETIAIRTFGGRVGRAKRGLWHGGGTDPIGYDYIEGELVINEDEAMQIQKVYELYAAGHTLEEISRAMEGQKTKHGDWRHSSTIGNVLDNPLYSGTVHFDEAVTPDSHDRIVSEKLDNEVKRRRKKLKKAQFTRPDSEHLLTSFIRCARCGARYFAKRQHSGNIYYCCHSRAKVNKKMVKDPSCKNENIPKEVLDKKVIEKLRDFSKAPNLVEIILQQKKTTEGVGGLSAEAKTEIASIEDEIKKHMSLYGKNIVPEEAIATTIKDLYAKKQAISHHEGVEDSLVAEVMTSYSVGRLRNMLRKFTELSNSEDVKGLRVILSEIVDFIAIDGEKIEVHLSL